MEEQWLAKWLKAGYPHFKEASGLPVWFLPAHRFDGIADELGDKAILEMSQPLGLANAVEGLFEKTPSPDMLSEQGWREAVASWPLLSQVKHFINAFLAAADMVMSAFRSRRLSIEPSVTWRGMASLGFAPFVPQGKDLLEKVAVVLKGRADQPAELVTRYAGAVVRGDILTIKRVDECISSHQKWSKWTAVFLHKAQSFPYTTKLIGVTPPVSAEVAQVLAEMAKEGQDAESG